MPEVQTQTIRRPIAGKGPSPELQARWAKMFGMGACACQEDWELPADYNLDKLRCEYDRLPASILVAGQAFATLIIQPTVGSRDFCPVAWLSTVKDSVDPQLGRSVVITDVTIGPCTLLPFSNRAPVAADFTVAGVSFLDTDELDPAARDNCACPTPKWPCFTNAANNCALSITFFNLNPVGITARARVEVLGKAISSCLSWRQATAQNSAPRPQM